MLPEKLHRTVYLFLDLLREVIDVLLALKAFGQRPPDATALAQEKVFIPMALSQEKGFTPMALPQEKVFTPMVLPQEKAIKNECLCRCDCCDCCPC